MYNESCDTACLYLEVMAHFVQKLKMIKNTHIVPIFLKKLRTRPIKNRRKIQYFIARIALHKIGNFYQNEWKIG